MKRLIMAALAAIAAPDLAAVRAQDLPQPPVARVEARRLAMFETGSFLESIVVSRDGRLLIADHHARTILQMMPDGRPEVMARLDFEIRGLGLDLDDTLYATGKAASGTETLFKIDRAGKAVPIVSLPDARFLNGLALLRPGVLLAADSFSDTIWRIDVRAATAAPWLRDERLSPNPQAPRIPGANGIKLHGGAAYVSNSGRATVLRVPIDADGKAGAPVPYAEGIVIDDFAFSAGGDLYGTTHIFNSVVVIRRDGTRSTIAIAADGVTGSTALAFGTRPSDRDTLYVVGDGGVFAPPAGGVVPAELVALKVGATGLGRDAALSWLPRPPTIEPIATHIVDCATAPGKEHLRASVGPDYLRYLELNNERIAFAGQLSDEPGGSPSGRLYFVKTGDPDEAKAFIEASPYFVAGMYAQCRVKPFRAILGSALGGVGWPEAASRGPRP